MMELDQGVRRTGWQAQGPGAEVPDNGGDQQSEDHGEPGAAPDLEDQLDRQQADNGKRDGAGRGQHAEEVQQAGIDHGDLRLQAMRIDDCRDSIGGVVEAIDELEPQRDQQRQAEQEERAPCQWFGVCRVHVTDQPRDGPEQAKCEDDQEYQDPRDVGPAIEVGPISVGMGMGMGMAVRTANRRCCRI